MIKLIKRFLKDEKGNALIETAVSIPMLMGLFMSLVFFTIAMRYQLVISMAAKEGAREYQVSMGDEGKARSRAYQELSIGRVIGANVSINGDEVTVTKPYGFYIPLANKYLLNIKSTHVFKKEIVERYYEPNW